LPEGFIARRSEADVRIYPLHMHSEIVLQGGEYGVGLIDAESATDRQIRSAGSASSISMSEYRLMSARTPPEAVRIDQLTLPPGRSGPTRHRKRPQRSIFCPNTTSRPASIPPGFSLYLEQKSQHRLCDAHIPRPFQEMNGKRRPESRTTYWFAYTVNGRALSYDQKASPAPDERPAMPEAPHQSGCLY
jgi:hypothetical protein